MRRNKKKVLRPSQLDKLYAEILPLLITSFHIEKPWPYYLKKGMHFGRSTYPVILVFYGTKDVPEQKMYNYSVPVKYFDSICMILLKKDVQSLINF